MLSLILAAALAMLPDPASTPGALNPAVTQATIGETICKPGWTKTIRPPASFTNRLKAQQLAALGLANLDPHSVEEDHRVPLELGGAPRDPANLYPEPWPGEFGAWQKDRTETQAKRRVCRGQLTLEQARAIFLGDWTITHQQWFGSGPAP